MIGIEYKWDGDKVISGLDEVASLIERPTPLLNEWRDYRTAEFNNQMDSGIDPYGVSVAPLSAMYAIAKAKEYGGKPIREASGSTRSTYKCEVQGNQVVETVSGKVAGFLQEGTSKMPARKLLPDSGMPAKDQSRLDSLSIKFLQEAIRKL